jgi:cation diffusion facilitator family transporter
MNLHAPTTPAHDHFFLGANHQRNESKVWLVIALTASMMLVEIVAGTVYGSMALVADGWHMSTHAGAMLITALAYRFARRHAGNPRFTFGTGKLGDLAGFASAVVLALIALLIGWESLVRLTQPIQIDFNQAIAVAVVGLLINLVCAWLLKDDHAHHAHHGHAHGHGHGHGHHHDHDDDHHAPGKGRDNNLRAAYVHVLADALTSILAIVALLLGRSYGWLWADPLMGADPGLRQRAAGRRRRGAGSAAGDLRWAGQLDRAGYVAHARAVLAAGSQAHRAAAAGGAGGRRPGASAAGGVLMRGDAHPA